MYNEENNEKSYFFRNLIVKILLVLLFVFLLMWLFPMPNLNPFYDKIFTQNINSMTDAARSYYTVTRLPAKEGETKTLTLKEMLDNKMLIEFTDSDGKKCDVNKSYVSVTKKDGEYTFKTNLSCSNQEDYVVTYFGCYDVCEGDSCKETEVIEYEFYKITTEKFIDKYVCDTGYTLSGTKCVKSTSSEENESAIANCPTGYNYNSNIKKCEKSVSDSFDAELKCPTGYIYASSMNTCIDTSTSTVDANYTYKCTTGTLSGTKCVGTTTTTVPATPSYSCATGETLSTDKTKCTTETPSIITYSCSNGTLSGTSCIITETHTSSQTCSYTDWVCSYPVYSYRKGTSSTDTYKIKVLYELVTGGFKHEECTRRYNCTGGGTYTTTRTEPATPSYSCPAGATISADKTKCTTETPSTVTYNCTTGTKNGDKCIVTTPAETDALKEYKCTTGTLSGTKCIIDVTLTADPTYSCVYGNLNGNKCIVTVSDKKDPCYSCKSGYSLVGTMCYKTITVTDSKNATIIYKTASKKVYKWSRSKTLEGWTATGRTRTVTVSI